MAQTKTITSARVKIMPHDEIISAYDNPETDSHDVKPTSAGKDEKKKRTEGTTIIASSTYPTTTAQF